MSQHPDLPLVVARRGLNVYRSATTAGQLRSAIEHLGMLPGLRWTTLPADQGLLVAAREQRELARLRDLDPGTGLFNRRRFSRRIREAWTDPTARTPGIALLVVTLPRSAELRLLARAGYCCGLALRPGDLTARISARRLAALLPSVSREDAVTVAERLRAVLAASELCGPESGVSVRLFVREYGSVSTPYA